MVSGSRKDQGRRAWVIVAVAALALIIAVSVAWTSFTDASAPSASGSPSATPSAPGPSSSPASTPSGSPAPTPSGSSAPPLPSPSATPSLAQAPSSVDADLAIDAFNDAFYIETARGGQYRLSLGSAKTVPFWRGAELIEMVEDAYARTRRPVYRKMIVALHRGMVSRYGGDWTRNRTFNDDVVWMVIASIRAYDITGRRTYLDMARRNFDRIYRRAWSGDFDGGLWWTTDRNEKNACINNPASIAASLLYRRTGHASYLRKATRLYAWVRSHLFEAASGRVNDHVSRGADGGAMVDYGTFTYNQGTFLGAADLLYRVTKQASYKSDAVNAIAFARNSLTEGGVLRDEGGDDGGGFKGIFMRYAVGFTRRQHIGDFDAWFRQNAAAAWAHRNSRGLMGTDWTRRADDAGIVAFDASSGVVALQLTAE